MKKKNVKRDSVKVRTEKTSAASTICEAIKRTPLIACDTSPMPFPHLECTWNQSICEKLAELQKLLDSVSYRYETIFVVSASNSYYSAFTLRMSMKAECAVQRNGTIVELRHNSLHSINQLDWIIQDFPRWIRDILWNIEKHESDEWLLINGERIFDPHK